MASSSSKLILSPKKLIHKKTKKKKSPIKSQNRRRNRTPTKTTTFIKTLISFRRRILKLFSSLSSTPSPKYKYKYHSLQKPLLMPQDHFPIKTLRFDHHHHNNNPKKLPPQVESKPTLVLDLDETLIHSTANFPTGRFDFVVTQNIGGQIVNFYVRKRPRLDLFLERVVKKGFEVVLFTAGLQEYASLVVDRIDPERAVFEHRLYREDCKEVEEDGVGVGGGFRYVKDLGELGREMGRVVIVDDNPNAYALQPGNAVRVRAFVDEEEDEELERVWRVLERCAGEEDVRRVLEEEEGKVEGEEMVMVEL